MNGAFSMPAAGSAATTGSLPSPDLIWPYHVTGPDGRLIAITATLWGARHIIDREKAKQARPEREPDNWWDSPVIYREPK